MFPEAARREPHEPDSSGIIDRIDARDVEDDAARGRLDAVSTDSISTRLRSFVDDTDDWDRQHILPHFQNRRRQTTNRTSAFRPSQSVPRADD